MLKQMILTLLFKTAIGRAEIVIRTKERGIYHFDCLT